MKVWKSENNLLKNKWINKKTTNITKNKQHFKKMSIILALTIEIYVFPRRNTRDPSFHLRSIWSHWCLWNIVVLQRPYLCIYDKVTYKWTCGYAFMGAVCFFLTSHPFRLSLHKWEVYWLYMLVCSEGLLRFYALHHRVLNQMHLRGSGFGQNCL